MTTEEVVAQFGFDPETIGNRHRGYWVISEPDDSDTYAGAKAGDLCVKARDGGGNPPDCTVGRHVNYVGTSQDDFDCTYRYYYFRPLGAAAEKGEAHQ